MSFVRVALLLVLTLPAVSGATSAAGSDSTQTTRPTSGARPVAQSQPYPAVSFNHRTPRAGAAFTGIVAAFPEPDRLHVKSLKCLAILGGHYEGQGEQRVLVGGRLLRPILHRYHDFAGNLGAVTCGWSLPRSASGKLLSLQPLGCSDACGPYGLTIEYTVDGKGAQGSYAFRDWKVAPPAR